VIHSGDYKFDHTPVDNWPTDYAKLGDFSGRGVLALLSDSTNADKPGWTPSERVIDPAFDEVFSEAPGRIIIASFASLISRMQQVANAAERHGRQMAFVGTSMIENAKMARKLGYLNIPDDLVVSIDQALRMSPEQVVLMSTGPRVSLPRSWAVCRLEPVKLISSRYRDPILHPSREMKMSSHYQSSLPPWRVIYEPIAPCVSDTPARKK
jgi:mRNA degradation ribonuclease J1/J2